MKNHDPWAVFYCLLTRGPLMSAYPVPVAVAGYANRWKATRQYVPYPS